MAKLQPAGKINVSRVSATKERQVGKVGQQIGIKPSVAQVQEKKRVEGELSKAQSILGQAQTVEQYEIQFGKLTAEQKSYFSTPTQVKEKAEAEKQAFIKSNISRADSEIARYNERIKQAQEKIAEYRRLEQTKGQDYGDRIDRYEDEIDEYRRYANYYSQAKSRYLSKGVSFSDADNWVDSQVSAWKSRKEARRAAKKRAREIEAQLGNQVGFVPGISTGTITTEGPIAQSVTFDKISPPKTKIKEPVVSTLEVAPTFSQKFKEQTSQKGFIKGTLGFIGAQTSELYGKTEQKLFSKTGGLFGSPIEPRGVSKGIEKGVTYAPYFSQAGPLLLVTGGTEELVTPSGRARIGAQAESFEERGLDPRVAKPLAYSIPIAETGLGLIGLRAQTKNLIQSQSLKTFERSPIKVTGTRFETGGKGFDVLTATKGTGRIKQTSQIVQPFYTTKTGGFTLEGGKGLSLTQLGKKEFTLTKFDTTGFGRTTTGIPKRNIGSIKYSLKGAEGTAGRFKVNVGSEARFKVTKQLSPTGRFETVAKGTKYFRGETIRSPFIGVGKETGDVIKVIGGKPTKARVDIIEGKTSLLAKPEVFGTIRRFKPNKPTEGTQVVTGTQPSTFKPTTTQITTPTAPSYASQLSRTVSKVSTPEFRPSITGRAISPVKQETTIKQSQVPKQLVTIRPSIKPAVTTQQIFRPTVKEKTRQIAIQQPKIIEQSKTIQKQLISPSQQIKQIPRTRTAQRLQPKQLQRFAPRISPITSIPKTPRPVSPFILPPIGFGFNAVFSGKERRGFDVQVLSGKKYVTINKEPLSKDFALSEGAKAVDNTTSARFRVIPSRKKGTPLGAVGNYFSFNRNKFRMYRKVMNVPEDLGPLVYIEKSGARIDTSGERRGLSLAKYIKKRRNPIGNLF